MILIYTMKKLVLISLMLFAVLAVNAQNRTTGFVSTGQNVNVRTGPGTSFPVLRDGQTRYRLNKNELVFDRGERKNGFCLVELRFAEIPEEDEVVGWVSARYLRKVNLCQNCGGWGTDGPDAEHLTKCKTCKGKGYIR